MFCDFIVDATQVQSYRKYSKGHIIYDALLCHPFTYVREKKQLRYPPYEAEPELALL